MINIVKIGGNVVDNPVALRSFLKDFASLPGPKILVHGGGREATRLSGALQIPTTMIEGRRVTDAATLEVVTMVYAGLINKRIVALLQSHRCNAVGLSGADAHIIPASRRSPQPVDYGFVGDIDAADINASFLRQLLEAHTVPVICAVCYDGHDSLLNCNADSVAAAVAIGASRIDAQVNLTYCFEMPGVLADVADPDSLITVVTRESFHRLKAEGIVAKGMLPKIDNALRCAAAGVHQVRICSADNLSRELGTIIREL